MAGARRSTGSRAAGGPRLLYLSYADAGGTALRTEVCDHLFRPGRGLWHLSGYVLSREGAASLLRAMPVVGPVDLWMNYQFAELGALALSSPAIAQRRDAVSDNAYSIMPYLARAGVVDGGHGARPPDVAGRGPLLAWTGGAERESLAMALSLLGLRVRAFDGDEEPLDLRRLSDAWRTFDALVDPPLVPAALSAAVGSERTLVLLEAGARTPDGLELGHLPAGAVRLSGAPRRRRRRLGGHLRSPRDRQACRSHSRLARHERSACFGMAGHPLRDRAAEKRRHGWPMDDSPWVLPSSCRWRPTMGECRSAPTVALASAEAPLTEASASFPGVTETFPGNLASFAPETLEYGDAGVRVVVDAAAGGLRPYRSGALASVRAFTLRAFPRLTSGPRLDLD